MDFITMNVTMDVFSILLIGILLLYALLQPGARQRQNLTFCLMCLCNLAMLVGDIPNWLCQGYGRAWYPAVLWLGLLVQYLGGLLASLSYTWYLQAYLAPRARVNRRVSTVVLLLTVVNGILIAVNLWTGIFYYFEQNIYHRGDWWWLSQAFPPVIMLINTGVILRHRACMRPKDVLALLGYMVLTLVAILIQSAFYGLALVYPTLTFAILIIFLNIQSEQAMLVKQQEDELEKSRISIMLSQIKPHFLYNVLTSIKSLCQEDAPRAEQAMEHFADFLRGNIDALSTGALIPFQQELLHTRHYLELEQMRFESLLHVEYDTPVACFSLPPLTLQPLAENAVRYGGLGRAGGGTVTIATAETEDAFLVIVTDNGPGFSAAQNRDGSHAHIGICNVRERLKTQCNGTLTLESAPNCGTRAVITLPKESSRQ